MILQHIIPIPKHAIPIPIPIPIPITCILYIMFINVDALAVYRWSKIIRVKSND